MTKKEIQSRVLHNGEKIKLSNFSWDENTNTFSSELDKLVLDFNSINNINFITGSNCIFKTGSDCTFKTGSDCTFKTGSDCTFKTGSDCTFNTDSDCTFKTGSGCTFYTGFKCIFKTDSDCTFSTDSDCTFSTTYNCTFNTGSDCTFNTGSNSVIIRKDTFEIINCNGYNEIQLNPYSIKGFISKINNEIDFHMEIEGVRTPHIIIDSILSKIIRKKGSVLEVINHGETEISYVVTNGLVHSHGKTIKEAKESLIYKISDRDITEYNNFTLDSVISLEKGIEMYRKITGSCESETKSFVDNLVDKKDSYSIREIIELTKGRFNNEMIVKFFNK